MVNNSNNNKNNQDVGDKNTSSISRDISGGGGATKSWVTTASGQSVSTSGSVGSPSSRSEAAVATPASDSTFLRLNNLDIQGDDAGSQGAIGNKKKKRGQRAAGGDKTGRGLRQFSMKVCEKVESKGRTTYNEYWKLVIIFDLCSLHKNQNGLFSCGITCHCSLFDCNNESLGIRNRIEKKAAYLQELEEQYVGLQKLVQRNEQLYGSGNAPNGGVALPFILVQTRPHATVEVEISEDMQLVHFDFNSTPFELHDDNYVLKAMKLCENPRGDGVTQNIHLDGGESSHMPSIYQPSRSNMSGRPPTSSPVPGILKARVKHEH
ncbi:transcription factor DPB isoform X1 [Olea europaea subsp. europaea]|uniref:Transcription factor DPB isoform X1 n=1 Tax=Olea europaea subsp. europaea TaxID=158383 RepID=A0A8S0TXE8_OLEEU|nr:transcription factor DPB isoform X1 [Olea europaea subsp. europaea]